MAKNGKKQKMKTCAKPKKFPMSPGNYVVLTRVLAHFSFLFSSKPNDTPWQFQR